MDATADGAKALGDELFHLLVESVEEYAIFAMDAGGRVVHWNAGAKRILGYDEDEVLGERLDRIFTPEQIEAGAPGRELSTAEATGRAADERWHVRKDGSRFWALGVVVALRAPDGTLEGFGKILRDRTDLKERQERLEDRADALAQADERKNLFLAKLSHELRNPLAALANCAHLVRLSAASTPTLAPLADMMDRQLAHLRRLIDDLLDLTRIARGSLQLERARLDLGRLLEEASESVAMTARSRNQELAVALPDREVVVDGDRARLRQVFANLLDNACKFTPPGGRISLTLERDDREALVRVGDNGIGIPREEMPRLFEPFSQVHHVREHAQAGLGLGLSLVRDLVALHGGSVQVRSDGEGKGSEFIVRLPLPRDAGP